MDAVQDYKRKVVGADKDLPKKNRIGNRMRKLKSLRMKIGPCDCAQDLPLTGSAAYIDNIITAAMWP